jgi:hypothetical protein
VLTAVEFDPTPTAAAPPPCIRIEALTAVEWLAHSLVSTNAADSAAPAVPPAEAFATMVKVWLARNVMFVAVAVAPLR